MKTHIATSLILFSTLTIMAQKMPPPTPPIPLGSTVTASEPYSKQSSNSSVSITNTDDYYKFRARFDDYKMQSIIDVLISEMGSKNLVKNSKGYHWVLNSSGDEIYAIDLRNGKLHMFIDKNIASNNLVEKFSELGLLIRDIISNDNASKDRADALQRKSEILARSSKNMKREANRLKNQDEEDAQRFDKKAMQDEEEAKRIEEEAKRKGAVGSLIKKLLNDNKTRLNVYTNNTSWKWPNFQEELLTYLVTNHLTKDELIVNLSIDDTGIYCNGNKLNSTQIKAFNTLSASHNFAFKNFSFNKENNHIVILDGTNAEFEKLLNTLKNKGLLPSTSKKIHMEINGNSLVINGTVLSATDTSKYNKLMQEHYIIPSPGKIIDITPTYAKVGYNLNSNTFIGTFMGL